jgi:hypothetical protein
MDHDEIVGELYMELVKGYQYYSHLPEGQLLAVLRRMMDNRVAELTYKYYKTHRKAAIGSLSISKQDDNESEGYLNYNNFRYVSTDGSEMMDPAITLESLDRVASTYDALSDEARQVLSAILDGDAMLGEQLALSGIRASFVFKRGTVKLKPFHVAKALAMDEDIVKKNFKEIKKAYAEVCSG